MSKKSFIDSVEVKSPCSEEWSQMRGTDKIRFCSHCATSVNNLSEMTRKKATRLVRASNGNLCIRYIADPKTKRPMFAEQLLQITRRAPSVATGVLSASIALSSHAYAQETPSVEIPQVPAVEKPIDSVAKLGASGRISGTIFDQDKSVIEGASVSLYSVDVAMTLRKTTNDRGEYKFENLPTGTYRLESESAGFAKSIRNISISDAQEEVLEVTLEVGPIEVSVDVVAGDYDIQTTVSGGIGFTEYGTPLTKAVANEDVDEVRSLLVKGANPNGKDENYDKITPLFIAVENGNAEIIEILLNFGAKTNARDAAKQTPIMRLDDDATPELVDLLVRYGAKVDLADKEGNTALILAAEQVKPEVLKALIDAGADVRAKNKLGRTALMEAAENDDLESVRLLLEAGAEVNVRDKEGDSAWDLTSNDDVEQLLESYGAETKDDDEPVIR